MNSEEAFFVSPFTAVLWVILQLFWIAIFVLGSIVFKGESPFIFNYINIFLLILLIILPVLAFIVSFIFLPIHFSRTHISENGLRCTVFGKEIKRIQWSEIKYCTAFAPDGYHKVCIVFSKHVITEKERRKRIFYLNAQKNDLFFLPYKNSVLNALPEQYRPSRVYRLGEPLP